MVMLEPIVGCLTCFQSSGLNFVHVKNFRSIQDALRKHFWFEEADFKLAVICLTCWEQINNFYRFHNSVEELYQNRTSNGVHVKPEPGTDRSVWLEEVLPECSSNNMQVDTEQQEYSANGDDIVADESMVDPLMKSNSHQGDLEYPVCHEDIPNHEQKQHVEHEHPARLITCDVCSQGFCSKSSLMKHKQTHEKQQCLLCPQILQDGKSLRDHARKMHPDAMVCCSCKQVFPSKAALQTHKVEVQWLGDTHDDHQTDAFKNLPASTRGETIDFKYVKLYQNLRVLLTDCLVGGRARCPGDDSEQLISSLVVKEGQIIEDPREEIVQQKDIHGESEYSDQDFERDQEDLESGDDSEPLISTIVVKEERIIEDPCEEIDQQKGNQSDQSVERDQNDSKQNFQRHLQYIHSDDNMKHADLDDSGLPKSRSTEQPDRSHRFPDNPNLFRCEKCKKDFRSKLFYRQHLRHAHGGKSFTFGQSRKSYASESMLRRHNTKDHLGDDNRKWKCPQCEKSFTSRLSLRRHVRRVRHGAPQFSCDVCSKKFRIEARLQEHKLKHKELQCLRCPQLFPYGKGLREHVLELHPGTELPVLCLICSHVLPNKVALDAHRIQHHKGQDIVADENDCMVDDHPEGSGNNAGVETKQFDSTIIVKEVQSEPIVQQMETFDDKMEREQKGSEANVVHQKSRSTYALFSMRRQLPDSYIRKHVKYICDKCGLESLTFKLFTDHALLEHGDNSPFVACCGRIFRKKYVLFRHVEKVRNPDTFSCKDCKLSFRSIQYYRLHLIHSHGHKRFNCDKCSNFFSSKHSLNRHMRTHMHTYPHLESDMDREGENLYLDGNSLDSRAETSKSQEHEHQNTFMDVCPEETLPKLSIEDELVSIIVKSETKVGESDCLEEGLPECSYATAVETEQRDQTRNDSDSDEAGRDSDEETIFKQQLMDDELITQHVQYICEHCGEESPSFIHFKDHVQHEHSKAFFVRCCGRKFFRKYLLLEHVKFVNNPDSFRCNRCPNKYSTSHRLRLHLKKFHAFKNILLLKCDSCEETFDDEDAYTHHRKEHDGAGDTTTTCDLCDDIFTNRVNLDRHIRKKHPDAPKMICEICCAEFVVKKWFLAHTLGHERENAVDGMFKCGQCPARFTEINQRKLHVQDHAGWELDSWAHLFTELPPYVCNVCSKVFRTETLYQQHSLKHEKPTFYCPDCPQQFMDHKLLLVHVQTAHKEAKLVCKRCKLGFPNLHALQDHMVKKHGAKSRCPFCEETFDALELLNDHIAAVHNGSKPYVCGVCARGYCTSYNLRRHMTIEHPGEGKE